MSISRIVLADDDADQLEITATLLKNEGYHVTMANSGVDALKKIIQTPPDLVLSDVEMPGMTGFEVARRMSDDPFLRNIPVILLSGKRITAEDKVAGLGMGSDDYILKPFTPDELLARVRAVLRRNEIGLDANPLTRLPGNSSILREIEDRLLAKTPFAILYADLNHFKAYNDRYGFLRGDEVIRFSARVLLDNAKAQSPNNFVGHVGGDDFVVITPPEQAEGLCQTIIQSFDKGISFFYEPADRGGIEVIDRQGQKVKYPVMGIAIGVVSNQKKQIQSVGEVSQIGAELKKHAKSLGGSRYVVDQRVGDRRPGEAAG
jgi:diguanylate cyclase (GGDEF)-like protein